MTVDVASIDSRSKMRGMDPEAGRTGACGGVGATGTGGRFCCVGLLTIGAGVGLTIGILNWAILGIPLALSAPTGLLLGLVVCILVSPGMRHELAEQKRIDREYKQSLLQRKGRSGAFTQFD